MRVRKDCKNCRKSFVFTSDEEIFINDMRAGGHSPEQIDMFIKRMRKQDVPMFCNECAERLLGLDFIVAHGGDSCFDYSHAEFERAIEVGIEKPMYAQPAKYMRHTPYQVQL